MPIKVVVARATNGTVLAEETYGKAEHFVTREGMLAVMESHFTDANIVAVYAPEKWVSAERVDGANT